MVPNYLISFLTFSIFFFRMFNSSQLLSLVRASLVAPSSTSTVTGSPLLLVNHWLTALRVSVARHSSARDETEVALCVKDLNSPNFHPSMVSLWVTDSFEIKDTERDLLAKLLVNLVKSQDGTLSQSQLIKG